MARSSRVIAGLAAAIAAAVLRGDVTVQDGGTTSASNTGVLVDGAVTRRLHLTGRELGELPQHSVTLTYTSASGTRTRTYTGPLPLEVLNHLQPRFA